MATILSTAGLAIFLLLGLAHAALTATSTPEGGGMMPSNLEVRQAMSIRGGLGLAPTIDSTLYRAWIGFNFSHAFGIIGIAGIMLWQVLAGFSDAVDRAWFVTAAVAVPIVYFVLAVRYWFDKPRNGVALGALLLWAGIILELAQ